MTVSQVIKQSALPRVEAEILLAFVLKKNREYLLTHPEAAINVPASRIFFFLEKKRLKNWPIAYLIGHKEFYGLDFKVCPAVLTPRPETEIIVEEIVRLSQETERPLIIDIGTGSGAIIISIAKELKRLAPSIYAKSEYTGLDISAPALKLARVNARQHGLDKKIIFKYGDLLKPIIKTIPGRDLVIAANLPYLTPAQIKRAPSISREPRLALNGGSDGLKLYRRLLSQLIKAKARSIALVCEIDPTQARPLKAMMKKLWLKVSIKIQPDLTKKNRFVVMSLKNS